MTRQGTNMAFLNSEHANHEGAECPSTTGPVSIRRSPACLEKGDVFRTLGFPDKFIVGLDTMAMTTSKGLPGFRDIPPGPHFLWVQQPGGVSRCGYWFVTEAEGLVRNKEWNAYDEVLGEASHFAAAKQRDDMETAYPTLQPYTLHDHREENSRPLGDTLPDWAQSPASLWNALTNAISTQTLARITGKPDADEYLVDSVDCVRDLSRDENPSASPKASTSCAINELNFLFTRDFHDLQLLDLDPTTKARVADTSARVDALLTTTTITNPLPPPTEQDILAELQFTFLTGTHLSNPACLSQWWNLVLKIVLRAHTLAVTRPRLVSALLRTLHAQLLYMEHYFGSSSSSHGDGDGGDGGGTERKNGPSVEDRPIFQYKPLYKGKLRQMLVEYKSRLGELLPGGGGTAEQEAMGRAWEELEAWLWRWGWDLRGGGECGADGRERDDDGEEEEVPPADSEDEEDEQPVVVELDGEGREVGLVSFRD